MKEGMKEGVKVGEQNANIKTAMAMLVKGFDVPPAACAGVGQRSHRNRSYHQRLKQRPN